MGQPDTVTKTFMQNPEVFAEVFNYFIYKGEQVIKPENLQELDSTEIIDPFGKDDGVEPAVQKFRDVLKLASIMTDGKITYCLLAIENQTEIHYAMPVKNALYDFIQYSKQVIAISKRHKDNKVHRSRAEFLSGLRKEDTITPVITLTVSFSADKWDGPLSLHEMFGDYPQEILQFVPNYRINLIQPATLNDEALAKFKTDFGAVMEFIKASKEKSKLKTLLETNEHFSNMSFEAARVIESCTNRKLNTLLQPQGGRVNMCKALDDLIEDARQEGIQKARNLMESKINDVKLEEQLNSELTRIDDFITAAYNMINELHVSQDKALEILNIPSNLLDNVKDGLKEKLLCEDLPNDGTFPKSSSEVNLMSMFGKTQK